MDHPLIDLISARIAEAERNGEFDNLPGAGKPLPRHDDPENVLLNRLMAENGAVPEFVTLSRKLEGLRAEMAATGEPLRRQDILKDMSMMEARIALARRAWGS
ncbi:DUF1992 domain-containing protein [Pseudoroseicyclus tamaricis]|uniref:DUF1992 domain-containing protein n=1 Tax=Pseudoroseicyclus tamaricis TaxID=2705421 RepID=A0A6B2JW64_9RHOB|nr:DUF1992 domain-containing protein [Pseudoroseicyclus tamaricis]NDV02350.1 DUF1992 domain-containing protein [Pseudoroseicyclus tamaricis]